MRLQPPRFRGANSAPLDAACGARFYRAVGSWDVVDGHELGREVVRFEQEVVPDDARLPVLELQTAETCGRRRKASTRADGRRPSASRRPEPLRAGRAFASVVWVAAPIPPAPGPPPHRGPIFRTSFLLVFTGLGGTAEFPCLTIRSLRAVTASTNFVIYRSPARCFLKRRRFGARNV